MKEKVNFNLLLKRKPDEQLMRHDKPKKNHHQVEEN